MADDPKLKITVDVFLDDGEDIVQILVSGSMRGYERETLFTTDEGIARVMMVCDLLLSAMGYSDGHPVRARWN